MARTRNKAKKIPMAPIEKKGTWKPPILISVKPKTGPEKLKRIILI